MKEKLEKTVKSLTTVRGWKLNEPKSAAHEFILNDVLHLPFLLLSKILR